MGLPARSASPNYWADCPRINGCDGCRSDSTVCRSIGTRPLPRLVASAAVQDTSIVVQRARGTYRVEFKKVARENEGL